MPRVWLGGDGGGGSQIAVQGQEDSIVSIKSHAGGEPTCAPPFFAYLSFCCLNNEQRSVPVSLLLWRLTSLPTTSRWRSVLVSPVYPLFRVRASLTRVPPRKTRARSTQEPGRTSGDEASESGREEEKSGRAADDTPPTTTPSPTHSLLSPADQAAMTLTDVTLEVKPGELVCVYGPTGCGKSSLLLSLLGEVRRAAGTVEVSARSRKCGRGG